MNKKIAVIFLLVLTVGLGLIILKQYRKVQGYALASCISSLNLNLALLQKRDIQITLAKSGDWEKLSSPDYQRIVSKILSGKSLDCSTKNGSLLDPWGHEFQIKARQLADGRFEFLVWSNGPDGLEATKDDINSSDAVVSRP
jgi:hypothetical protein